MVVKTTTLMVQQAPARALYSAELCNRQSGSWPDALVLRKEPVVLWASFKPEHRPSFMN